MKADITTKIYANAGIKPNQKGVNRIVKAVIINFGDERGDIIVTNDNFGTRRKYADFTEGKKNAGLNPFQIVFFSIEMGAVCNDRFIGTDDETHYFSELVEVAR